MNAIGPNPPRRNWLSNNWRIAIVGGALAALPGTYVVAAIYHALGASTPFALPTSPGPILIQVDPDRIVATQGPTHGIGELVHHLTAREA